MQPAPWRTPRAGLHTYQNQFHITQTRVYSVLRFYPFRDVLAVFHHLFLFVCPYIATCCFRSGFICSDVELYDTLAYFRPLTCYRSSDGYIYISTILLCLKSAQN